MIKKHLPLIVIILLCICSMELSGQRRKNSKSYIDVYPVRENHKWGYIKVYPEHEDGYISMIEPKYDYIGDVYLPWNDEAAKTARSPYRIFELDEKVGLLDESLNEIIPNEYKRIRPISEQFFAVETDSAFQLMGREKEKYLAGKTYDDIFMADAFPDQSLYYFFVKSNNKWGLQRLDGKVMFPTKYAIIKSAGKKGFYKVKSQVDKKRWTLVDSTGQLVVEKEYNEIQVLSEDFIATYNGSIWQMYLPSKPVNYPIHPSNISRFEFETIEPLNDTLVAVAPKASKQMIEDNAATVELWSIPLKQPLGRAKRRSRALGRQNPDLGRRDYIYNPWYKRLDDHYVTLVNRKDEIEYYRIIDNKGKLLVDTSFQGMLPSKKEGVYVVSMNGKAGMLIPSLDTLPYVPCEYQMIKPFQGNLAICRQSGYFGVIAMCEPGKYTEIPCLYTKLTILSGDRVQVDLDSMIVDYYLNDTCGFTRELVSLKGKVVSNSVQKDLREAKGVDPVFTSKYIPYRWEGQLIKFQPDLDTFALLMMMRGAKKIRIGQVPRKFLHYEPVDLLPGLTVSYHNKNKVTNTVFTQQLVSSKIRKIQLYNMEAQAAEPDQSIIGMRDFDYRYPYTAYLTNQGRVGLIDRYGKLLKKDGEDLTFSYIGPFIAGRARVALNGKIFFDKNRDAGITKKFSLGTRSAFLEEWHIKSIERPSKSRNEHGIYVKPTDETPIRWGYIDEQGNLLFEVEADHVKDYNYNDSTALILKNNGRVRLRRLEADYGMIDYEGNVLQNTTYNTVESYQKYHLVTVDSTPTIYFTKKGHQIFTNRTRLRPFSEGLSHFRSIDSLWGYVDALGNVVIEPQFELARPFSEGLAMVVDSTNFCSFINKQGQIVFRTMLTARQWRALGDFHEGRCWFKLPKSLQWGCYDRTGNVVIKPAFYSELNPTLRRDSLCPMPMDFHNGISIVTIGQNARNRKVGFIDSVGQYLVQPQSVHTVMPFNVYGVASFQKTEKGKWGIINKKGEIVLEPSYQFIDTFYNGLARVKLARQQWGMINVKGKEVIPARHVAVSKFKEGVVAVRRRFTEGWFFVDSTYQVKLAGPFFKVQDFKNGITMATDRENNNHLIHLSGDTIKLESGIPQFFADDFIGVKDTASNRSFFYADVAGRNIFGRFFQEIFPFKNGIAAVKRKNAGGIRGEMKGAINKRGVLVVPPKFRDIHIQADGNVIINPQRFYGMLSTNGKVILDPIYDRIIEYAEQNLFRVEQGEKVGYVQVIDEEPIWIWDLKY